MIKSKGQKGGNKSTNIQAENLTIINNGVSIKDVEQISKGVFDANILKFKDEAASLALERFEAITETLLSKLKDKPVEVLESFKQPSMQEALFIAQKGYAISGDENLADLLVDILVDRASTPQRNTLQIVLDESLITAPKLTDAQLDTLTIIFLIKYVFHHPIVNLETLDEYLQTYLKPFVRSLSEEESLYQHLEYCRCASVKTGHNEIEKIFENNYAALFSNGFRLESLKETVKDESIYMKYLIPCFHNPERYQMGYINFHQLEEALKSDGLDSMSMEVIEFNTLLRNSNFSTFDIAKFLRNRDPFMSDLFKVWKKSSLSNLKLTSVGMALGQANFRRKTGISMDLGIWIK